MSGGDCRISRASTVLLPSGPTDCMIGFNAIFLRFGIFASLMDQFS